MTSPADRQAGFTLIESLITLAIIGIGLAGAARLQATVTASMLEARSRVEALQLANQQQERLRTRHLYQTSPAPHPARAIAGNIATYQLSTAINHGKINGLTIKEVTIDWQIPNRHAHFTLTSQLPAPAHMAQIHRLD